MPCGFQCRAEFPGLSPQLLGLLARFFRGDFDVPKSHFLINISFGGIPNSRNVFFLQIFPKHNIEAKLQVKSAWSKQILRKTQKSTIALVISMYAVCTCMKTKKKNELLRNLLHNLLRNPDLALHQSLPDILRNLLRNPVEPDLALHQSLSDLLRNLLRNPVEPDLALPQSLPHLLRDLLRNPVEPDLALPQSLPHLLRNLLQSPAEPDLALHQSLRDLLRSAPSPEPRWTWPGAGTSAHRSYSRLKTPLAYAVGE